MLHERGARATIIQRLIKLTTPIEPPNPAATTMLRRTLRLEDPSHGSTFFLAIKSSPNIGGSRFFS